MKTLSKSIASLALVATSLVATTRISGASTSQSTKQKTPTCNSVSTTVIRRVLGGSPQKPQSQTSADVLICHYNTIDLIYLLHQNKTVFASDEKSNKGSAVKGIGQGAFSYGSKGSTAVSLQVLAGNVAFVISGSSAGLKKIEQLAIKIEPLIA